MFDYNGIAYLESMIPEYFRFTRKCSKANFYTREQYGYNL